MPLPNVRQAFFPYGMEQNEDGTWTFFNRSYKPVGVIAEEWALWDDPRHKLPIKGLGPAKLAKLDIHGLGTTKRIYFYDDKTRPDLSPQNLKLYLDKLALLIVL